MTIAFVALLVAAGTATGQGLPSSQRTLLIMRVLTYDRNLRVRADGQVRVAVIFKKGSRASEDERDALMLAANELSTRVVVAGMPVRFLAVPYEGRADLKARLTDLHPSAIYVCEGLQTAAAELARIAVETSVPTLCGDRELLRKGLAVALVDRGDRASLAVNLHAARGQGADLDSALLTLAERVDGTD